MEGMRIKTLNKAINELKFGINTFKMIGMFISVLFNYKANTEDDSFQKCIFILRKMSKGMR